MADANVRFPPIADVGPYRHPIRVTNRIWIMAFLAWEIWWAYVYFSAPVPDVKMHTVAALIFGVGVPVWLAGVCLMIVWVKRSVKRH